MSNFQACLSCLFSLKTTETPGCFWVVVLDWRAVPVNIRRYPMISTPENAKHPSCTISRNPHIFRSHACQRKVSAFEFVERKTGGGGGGGCVCVGGGGRSRTPPGAPLLMSHLCVLFFS